MAVAGFKRVEKIGVTRPTAAILGRASPRAIKAKRIHLTASGGDDLLHLDGVLSAVAEVVLVHEPDARWRHGGQAGA